VLFDASRENFYKTVLFRVSLCGLGFSVKTGFQNRQVFFSSWGDGDDDAFSFLKRHKKQSTATRSREREREKKTPHPERTSEEGFTAEREREQRVILREQEIDLFLPSKTQKRERSPFFWIPQKK